MRLAILILLVSVPALAKEFDWQEKLVKDGIHIDVRKVLGAQYREFRATIEMPAKAAHAIALLQDNKVCSKWLFRCKSSEIIETVSTTERYFHQVTSLPFPAKSRDAIFHTVISHDSDQSIKITLNSAPKKLPELEHIRITETRGFYRIDELDDDSILLTWQFYVDPAGTLPTFLVNSLVTELPFKSLSAFRDLIKQKPYNTASFIYNESGNPVNIVFTEND